MYNIDYGKAFRSLVDELKGYARRCGLHGAVLGVSGGIDSTVVAAIGCKVKEELESEGYPFTFLGVTMPTSTTDPDELHAAREVLFSFFDTASEINIEGVSEGFIEEIFKAELGNDTWGIAKGGPDSFHLRCGNIKSRSRMILLYDAAKAVNGIVLGTDNYSEYLLGFSTIGGDALFDYCPIQYMWKSEIFKFAEYIRDMYIVDEENDSTDEYIMKRRRHDAVSLSLALKPMDGLGISGDDMEQIGARDYYEVDSILYHDLKGLPQDPEIPNETVRKVLDRKRWTEYKRNHPVRVPRSVYEEV